MTGRVPRIVYLEETVSTNLDAMRLALAGEALPLWVSAGRQTAGRGRAGRRWASLPGNLQASLAFASQAAPARIGQVALVAGISAIDAVHATSSLAQNLRVRLKWPNDILIGTAKAGGILVESTAAAFEPPGIIAVAGFGINIASAPDNLGRAATALGDHGVTASPVEILDALADQMSRWLGTWDDGRGFEHIRAAWMDRAGPIGEPITFHAGSGLVSGTYQGLSAAGGLLAETHGERVEVTYGDIVLGAAT